MSKNDFKNCNPHLVGFLIASLILLIIAVIPNRNVESRVIFPPGSLLQSGDVTSVHIRDLEIVNADVSSTAAIAGSKLDLASYIANSHVSSSAAIAYSKLNLSGGIVNADINASAAIAKSKIASLVDLNTMAVKVTNAADAGLEARNETLFLRMGPAANTDGYAMFYLPSGRTIATTTLIVHYETSNSGNTTYSFYFRGSGNQAADQTDSSTLQTFATTDTTNAQYEHVVPAAAFNGITNSGTISVRIRREGTDASDTNGVDSYVIGMQFILN